jgi:hypothetical protein
LCWAQDNYGHAIAVAQTAEVAPVGYSATAISATARLERVAISNAGTIAGGAGPYGRPGGIGIDLRCDGEVFNTGSIAGGNAGTGGNLSRQRPLRAWHPPIPSSL